MLGTTKHLPSLHYLCFSHASVLVPKLLMSPFRAQVALIRVSCCAAGSYTFVHVTCRRCYQGRRLKTDEELLEADFAAYLGSDDEEDDEEEAAPGAGPGAAAGGKEDAAAIRERYR